MNTKLIAKNPVAYHNYNIEDTYEAGIVLTGTEIKSIRAGKVNLKDSYAIVGKRLQEYYDSKPKPIIDYYEDEDDYELPLSIQDKELLFVTSEEVCKIDTEFLLQYLETKAMDYTPKTLYIDREDTMITYGELSALGEKKEFGKMGICNENVLHAIYELIRIRFSTEFKDQISMGVDGWNLTPIISEETEVVITSNRLSDKEWIQREKETIRDTRRKNKGLLV